jgi:hypothetical protein
MESKTQKLNFCELSPYLKRPIAMLGSEREIFHTGCTEDDLTRPLHEGDDLELCVPHGDSSEHSLQHSSTEAEKELELPAHVRFHQMVLFGSGEYPLIPVVVVISYTIYISGLAIFALPSVSGFDSLDAMNSFFGYGYAHSEFELLNYFQSGSIVLETVANIWFGYNYCKSKNLQKLVAWTTQHSSMPETSIVSTLSRYLWIGSLLNIAFIAQQAVYSHTALQVGMSAVLSTALCHLSMLWLWTCATIHANIQECIRNISPASILSRETGPLLLSHLQRMKLISNYWSTNHAIRLVTSTVFATTDVMMYKQAKYSTSFSGTVKSHLGRHGICYLFEAFLLYAIVWMTAAAPGLVSDMFFSKVQCKLAGIAEGIGTTHDKHDKHDKEIESAATKLMHRVQYLQGRTGMHFVQIPMSMQKAITIGTALAYIIAAAVHAHTS